MSLTEQKRIVSWASEHSGSSNLLSDTHASSCESYFTSFAIEKDIYEYNFQTIPDLKGLLQEMWKGDETMESIVLTCSVAAFKEWSGKEEREEGIRASSDSQSATIEIPDFVYVF